MAKYKIGTESTGNKSIKMANGLWANPISTRTAILRRFVIGISVVLLTMLTFTMVLFATTLFDFGRVGNYLLFIVPSTWVIFSSCYVLINVKC